VSPFKEWVQLELWTDGLGNIGWKILAHENETLVLSLFQAGLLEMTEWWMDPSEDNPVVYTHLMHRDGRCHTRQSLVHDFSRRDEYVKLRHNSYRSHWLLVGRETYPSLVREFWWSVEWLWHRALGHFKASQKPPQPAAGAVPATVTEILYEPSERLETTSQPRAGNVIPFAGRRKRDDIRPL
jgi:hypothetical protein